MPRAATKRKASAADEGRKPHRKKLNVKPMITIPEVTTALRKEVPSRERKLQPTDYTLAQIRELAALQLTQAEVAAVLQVSANTLAEFLKTCEAAQEAFEAGAHVGKASVKRSQFVAAHKSVPAMIWWGKQHLGQSEKIQQDSKAEVNVQQTAVLSDETRELLKLIAQLPPRSALPPAAPPAPAIIDAEVVEVKET